MKAIVFCNYVFGIAAIQQLSENGISITCCINKSSNDSKYGSGIYDYLRNNSAVRWFYWKDWKYSPELKNENFDFGFSIGFKNIIPVESLNYPVYGIHFGGLYGSKGIRGKSTHKWSLLLGINKVGLSLYRLTENSIDIGALIKSEYIYLDKGDVVSQQCSVIKSLIKKYLVPNKLPRNQKVAINIRTEYSTYYPKAYPLTLNPKYLPSPISDIWHELDLIRYSDIEVEVYKREQHFVYNQSLQSIRRIVYFHGLGSNEKASEKLTCLASIFPEVEFISPMVEPIKWGNTKWKDEKELIGYLRGLLLKYDEPNTIFIFSSLSGLLFSSFLQEVTQVSTTIFITPILSLSNSTLDPAIKGYLNTKRQNDARQVLLNSSIYKGMGLSSVVLDYLKNMELLDNIATLNFKKYYLFAKDDNFIDSRNTVPQVIRKDIGAINRIALLPGKHRFNSLLQVYYLSCVIRKELR